MATKSKHTQMHFRSTKLFPLHICISLVRSEWKGLLQQIHNTMWHIDSWHLLMLSPVDHSLHFLASPIEFCVLLQSHQIATLNDFQQQQKVKTQITSVFIETVNSWIEWTKVKRPLFYCASTPFRHYWKRERKNDEIVSETLEWLFPTKNKIWGNSL